MIRNGVIAAAAVLALGTVAMATDASAESWRGHSGRSGTTMSTSGNLGTSTVNNGRLRGTGYAKTWNGSKTNFSKTSWNGGTRWDRHRRFGGGWSSGPSFGIGFADYGYGYGYDDWGPGYGYAADWGPSYAGYGASYAGDGGYGGCSCGAPGYAYGYGYDYPGYAYAAPVGFGVGVGFGFSGRPFHHHHHW